MDLAKYEALGNDAHISVRSYRKNGESVDTPVWYCRLENDIYLRTVRSSAKVRRLEAHGKAAFAPCRWNGEVISKWQSARVEILPDDDPLIPELNARMDAFYGKYRLEMTELMRQLGKPLCFVKLSPDPVSE